jgi:hypothetical protein
MNEALVLEILGRRGGTPEEFARTAAPLWIHVLFADESAPRRWTLPTTDADAQDAHAARRSDRTTCAGSFPLRSVCRNCTT